jgi:glutaryl-CoA dehydrogenase
MTIKVALPPTHQPYLEVGQLPADFYNYEELLSDSEREKVHRIRDFFRTEVAPIGEDYCARAEFPFELVKGFPTLGLLDCPNTPSTPKDPQDTAFLPGAGPPGVKSGAGFYDDYRR